VTAGLDTRPDLLLAFGVVTWAVIVALVLVIANLNLRLRRLERLRGEPDGQAHGSAAPAYGALVGRELVALTGDPATRALIVLSQSCRSCRRLLAELAVPGRVDPTVPVALAWADGMPGEPPPAGLPLIADGPRIAAELGVRVTPFALVAGEDGVVAWAGPVTDLPSLLARVGSRPTVPATRTDH
jgi:hypothetical protein